MADKIDQLVVKNSQGTDVAYDIDLPVDASPSIASLTASGNIASEDGTSSNKGSAKLKNALVSGSTYLGELQLVTGASALSGVHGLTMTSDSIIRDIGTSTTFTLNFPTLSNGASQTLATTDYVSGVNDGTNWTSLTINGVTKNISVGSSATDVQINGTSITSSGVANIITNSAYNASSNKIATMSDLPGTSNFVTLNTTQTITSAKTFSYTSGAYTSTTVVDYSGIDVTSQANSGIAVRGPNAFIVNYNGNNYAGFFHDDGSDVEMRKYTSGSTYTYTLPNATGVLALNGQAQPASDVYSWAKASTKPSYTHNEIGAGNLTVGNGSQYLNMRSGHDSYNGGIYYSTPGNEAVVFANKNSFTSWIFAATDVTRMANWTTLTPSMQIKNQKVAINKLIADGTNINYNLDVNGSVNATTVTINTKATMQYNTTDDCIEFIFA